MTDWQAGADTLPPGTIVWKYHNVYSWVTKTQIIVLSSIGHACFSVSSSPQGMMHVEKQRVVDGRSLRSVGRSVAAFPFIRSPPQIWIGMLVQRDYGSLYYPLVILSPVELTDRPDAAPLYSSKNPSENRRFITHKKGVSVSRGWPLVVPRVVGVGWVSPFVSSGYADAKV